MTSGDRTSAARLLGVPVGASADDIDAAFRRLARQHHPDLGGDEARFEQLVEARELLRHPSQPADRLVVSTRRDRLVAPVRRWQRQVLVKLGRRQLRVR